MMDKPSSFSMGRVLLAVLFLFSSPTLGEAGHIDNHPEGLVFLSTQLAPINEAFTFTHKILNGHTSPVHFITAHHKSFIDQLMMESDKKGVTSLAGGLVREFELLAASDRLTPLNELIPALQKNGIPKRLLELGKLTGPNLRMIPWMRASFTFVANRKALKFLPAGADIDHLTYEDFSLWAEKINRHSGGAKVGFPLGKQGLFPFFLTGYAYPSFTGSVVTRFNSIESIELWNSLRHLWKYVHPNSLTYNAMQKHLLSGEVWVGWDHTARLWEVFKERSDEFVAFPAPIGPYGRGSRSMVIGLGIPKSAPNPEQARTLIQYLTTAEVQMKILDNLGFLPVITPAESIILSSRFHSLIGALNKQMEGVENLPVRPPTGLDKREAEFNNIYLAAFTRIVLRNKEVSPVLSQQADHLRQLYQETKAPCPLPDLVGIAPCPVQ
jgi:multiple sugar transport system substrate-binding protein